MSLGRLNNPLYDERGQFIVNQQPEANMFGSFYMNPTGAIGSGVSSGNVLAVANPLDNRPAGGGKGGGKGGGSPQPNYIASTPRPSMGKGGGKGGGFAPAQNMYGGLGYNAYMGAGGIRPTSVPTQFSGFNQPTPTPRGGMTPLPETNFPLPFTPSPPPAPPAPPAGKGGGLQARNDFMNADNELNRIRGAQMELERKARQEALNRSYYDQPAPQPTGAGNLSDQEVIDYFTSRGEAVAMPSSPEFAKEAMDNLRARMPADLSQPPAPVQPNLRTMPASRNPFNRRFDMGQMERLNAAYRNRLERFQDPRRFAALEAMRTLMPRTTFASPEDEQRLRNELGIPAPQPASDYQLQQENFLKTRRLLNELGDPAPGMNRSRLGSGLGAGLGAFGLSNFFGGR